MQIDRLVATGPDPENARARLERFAENGGVVPPDEEGQRLLAAMLASGSFLPDILASDVERLERLRLDPFLRRPKPRSLLIEEIHRAAAGAKDFVGLMRALRQVRRQEMLRLGARELGWGTTLEVARELSALADGCLDAAVNFCDRELRVGYGEPVGTDEPASFVVLGMGKLGGEELNFSSDVDVIYIYSTDEGAAGRLTLHEYYARLSQGVTRALSEITDDGLIFRVDLRLRPEGRSGAICNSVPAAERYYETFGRTWERQALLRARPSAGDATLGERFLRTVEPFVHPRSVGPGTIDEVRSLRKLFVSSAEGPGFNVKLGSGGIRDIELCAQLLQLLWAGKRRELRERTTLPALHKLGVAGLLSEKEVRSLSEAYRFFRRIEHRVQLENAAQTHEMPADARGLERLACSLGYESREELVSLVARHRGAVTAVSSTLGEPDAGPSAQVLRMMDPASPRERIEAELSAAGFEDPVASADALDLARGRLPAAWLEEAIESPDPDRALVQFRDLALRGSLGLFTLLKDEPQLVRMLAGLFGTSERLSRHLIAHPAMWEPLVDGLGAPRLDERVWERALPARLEGLDEEEALREMRRYQAEEILRIGMHDVSGNLEPDEVSDQLSRLAQACLGAAVRQVAGRLVERFGHPAATLSVLALGSFGARETRYGSDLDLVFLYSRPGTTTKGMDHQEWFARLAQRLIGVLGALLDEGRLYEVDTRLRPSGEQGMLVTSYESFDRYHHSEAAPWERVALLRARPVFVASMTPGTPADDLSERLMNIAYEPIEEAAVRNELARMRALIETERATEARGAVHLRFSPGGLTDLEFLAAAEQLRSGAADPELRTTTPWRALQRLVARGELPAVLLEDYRFLQRASLRLRLLRDRPDDRLAAADRRHLARSLGESTAAFDAELATRRERVRHLFRERIAPEAPPVVIPADAS